MKRLTLALDSHQLSAYQKCPELFGYIWKRKIEPILTYSPYEKGKIIASMLEALYKLKMGAEYNEGGVLIKPPLTKESLFNIVEKILNPSSLKEEVKQLIETRFLQYYKQYKDESLKPIAVEKGFSKILYEDDRVLFVYEGRPDLVCLFPFQGSDPVLMVTDHKSQSRTAEIYVHNNQALGYCWGCEAEWFMYNIFGIQETGKPDQWFQRRPFHFTKGQIEHWKSETIWWFWRILMDIKNNSYHQSKQCEGKYGTCRYTQLCEQTATFAIEDLIRREYQPMEQKRAWEENKNGETA